LDFSGQLLRQEKDEASPVRVCGRDSLNAFILCFAGMKAFFVVKGSGHQSLRQKSASSRSGLSTQTRFAIDSRNY